MDNKGKRETGELASVWFGEPYEERDEDAIDIRPRRERRSVTDPSHGQRSSDVPQRARNAAQRPSGAQARDAGAQARAAGTQVREAGAQARAAGAQTRDAGAQARAAGAQAREAGVQAREATGSDAVQRDAAPQSTAGRGQQTPKTPAAQGSGHSSPEGVRRQTSIPPERMQAVRSIPSRSASPVSRSRSGRRRARLTVGCVIRRVLLVVLTVVVFAFGALLAVANTLANGPSETARSKAVMSAMQASAVKWLPGLFLPDEVVDKIVADSKVVVTDVRPITDVSGTDTPAAVTEDRWEKAIDGMIYENVNGKTFKGYVLLIKDPSRVSVGISDESFSYASRIFEIADKYGAIAAINGGEFPDNGVQTGANPIGLTYSGGRCVWDDGLRRTFIGFTSENKLYVGEGTTREQADAAGVRDAVAFQTGNTLITNDGENVTYYYADSNTGVAQRTAIGQLADGTVMFLVTDGRTASSMGATKNDIIDTFAEYGAVTAGLLDGGSSTMLYYRDWYDKYNVDKSQLDEWQQMGLVNRYKAFTNPRTIPTFFIVK